MKYNFGKKQIMKILMITVLSVVMTIFVYMTVFGTGTTRKGICTAEPYLRIRDEVSTGNIIGQIYANDVVAITGEKTASDGVVWYMVEHNGVVGYASSEYIVIIPDNTQNDTSTQISTADFEDYLNVQGFPDSYKQALRDLHALYPNWIFKAQHIDYDFYDAVQREKPLSLVWGGSISSWKSIEGEAYNWVSNTWRNYDSGYVRASEGIISYYMDPRNFLGINTVFQFLEQSFDGSLQSVDGVRQIISGTFMENDVTDSDGTILNYASAIYNAGAEFSVNPYVLAAMIVQEQGSQGTSRLISGTVSGYENLFNYFNVQAFSQGDKDAVQMGLWYAGGGNGSTTFLRPWNTRLKSIRGGAGFYSSGYINAGQTTLYLKKYNVQGSNPFSHQYMTNVQGAYGESLGLSKGYTQNMRETALSFLIPVYKNMPETPCAKPTGDGSVNMKLSNLGVDGFVLTPEFDPDVLEYMLVVSPSVSSVTIGATAMESSAVIEGLGVRELNYDSNVFEIKVTAGNGSTRIYKLTVAKEISDSFGKVSFKDNYSVADKIVHKIAPGTTVGTFKQSFVSEGSIVVYNSGGTVKDDSSVLCSGDRIKVYSTTGVEYSQYDMSVKGDVDFDGIITIGDLLKVRNMILGTTTLTELQSFSSDIDGDSIITIGDLLKIRNHILGVSALS